MQSAGLVALAEPVTRAMAWAELGLEITIERKNLPW